MEQEADMEFRFRHHIIDTSLPPGCYAQTTLADVDGDGKLEYIVGRQYGDIYGTNTTRLTTGRGIFWERTRLLTWAGALSTLTEMHT
jgi:hypothetical protein